MWTQVNEAYMGVVSVWTDAELIHIGDTAHYLFSNDWMTIVWVNEAIATVEAK